MIGILRLIDPEFMSELLIRARENGTENVTNWIGLTL